jgi:hypothetical protein
MERVPEGVARFHPRPLLKYGDVPENPVADPPLFPPHPIHWRGITHSPGSLYRSHLISRDYVGISLFPGFYAEMRTTIIDRNAGYAGLKLGEANFVFWGVTLRIIWRDFLGAILRPLVTLESAPL